jgi:hypothetical protein
MNPGHDGQYALLASNVDITHGATHTANWDCKNGDYAELIITLGSEAHTSATNPTVSLLASDDTVVTNFATVTADQSIVNTDERLVVYKVDLTSGKRYLRLAITAVSGSTNNNLTIGSAVGRLSRLKSGSAVSTTAAAASTSDTDITVV